MKRGDVVTVATGSGYGGKPRPALVIQADEYALSTVVVALFTGDLVDAPWSRPRFEPDEGNGLAKTSDLMVDILVTAPIAKVGKVVGQLGPEDMVRVDQALLVFLGLAG